jgi:argininosuccinate lyase
MTGDRAWSGRFEASPAAALDAINRSVDFDKRLWKYDIEGSLAHARMLLDIGLLDAGELQAIETGLAEVSVEWESGTFNVLASDEDIHMAVERRLTELVGEPGKKLHTGRSRNDQVATDVRLFVRDACDHTISMLLANIGRIAELARKHAGDPLPAYTHLQRGMPTTLGHHLLAWAEMFRRDVDRLTDVRRRANISPLGSGACVGSSIPLDRYQTAKALGFADLTRNSLDGVSDRDFVAEFLFVASLMGVHLSRLGEEIVLWSSQEFSFVRLGDDVTTGSSMMPNKKNPDGAELLRGKAGRMIGGLTGFLATLKGLPLTYNKDMQEDKEPLFDAYDTVTMCLNMLHVMLGSIEFKVARMRAACTGHVNATDLCEALVKQGVPLRTAHHQTGRLVALAVARDVELEALAFDEAKEIAPELTEGMLQDITLDALLASKDIFGATAPAQVLKQCEALEAWLNQTANAHAKN